MEQEFVKALPILHHLMKAGHQAYFVGGSRQRQLYETKNR